MKALTLLTLLCLAACSDETAEVAVKAPIDDDADPKKGCAPVPGKNPPPVEALVEGMHFRIEDGNAYLETDGNWEFAQVMYDVDFFSTHYVVEDCTVYRVDPESGTRYALHRSFTEDFEGAESLHDLVENLTRGWTTFTLQSPAAPTVSDYVALRKCILDYTCDFLDNEITIVDSGVSERGTVLRTFSVPKDDTMVTAKASLDSELFHAVAGERIRVGAWFKVVNGQPFTLIDLESSWIVGFPGLRVVLNESGVLHIELKWLDKPKFRQSGSGVPFPSGKWVHVELEALLSPNEDGHVIVRQDEKVIIDQTGKTLPLIDTVYNNLEIGISANNHTASNTEVLVDGVYFDVDQ